jgi:hypothetical protein
VKRRGRRVGLSGGNGGGHQTIKALFHKIIIGFTIVHCHAAE